MREDTRAGLSSHKEGQRVFRNMSEKGVCPRWGIRVSECAASTEPEADPGGPSRWESGWGVRPSINGWASAAP